TDQMSFLMLRIGFERLMEITKHYARKEYLFFPGLEKKNITSIPKVMWGVDDEIRQVMQKIKTKLDRGDTLELSEDIEAVLTKIIDMVTKENNILLPKLSETLSFYDWIKADQGSPEIGYFLETPTVSWSVEPEKEKPVKTTEQRRSEEIPFDAGSLNQVELNAMLNTLPMDMTFVDKDGFVKYFTQGKERIFARPTSVIGRQVSMCHPPKSVHIVEEIVESFKSGKKDHEDFYINMGPMFVYIRYFAVRDKENNYLGTLEVTQNIKPIRDLIGEKRLVE
ncbi:MAG TPA: PAS domain-containing protein, partial [Bacillota bacterium]|nr:PAS domain-containing protein [Bacillota bacterium]